jgi:hypothetical protein
LSSLRIPAAARQRRGSERRGRAPVDAAGLHRHPEPARRLPREGLRANGRMSERKNDVTRTADREILITRVVDAPPELVRKAWTEPEHVAQWWGPKGLTNTVHEMDAACGAIDPAPARRGRQRHCLSRPGRGVRLRRVFRPGGRSAAVSPGHARHA